MTTILSIHPEFRKACERKLLLLRLTLSDLFVSTTTIPLCRFQGLFAKRRFEKGEVICVYSGTVVRTREAMRMEDKAYLMRLGEQCYIDANHHLDVLARYINDCINPNKHNAVFDKQPTQNCAYVVALRAIEAGEEIFVSYGKFYWFKKYPIPVLDSLVTSIPIPPDFDAFL